VNRENSDAGELWKAILESMDGGVIAVDNNGRIIFFNRSAETITGFTREKAIGEKCSDILGGSLCRDACPLDEAARSDQPIFNYEARIKSKAGVRVPVNITTSPLRSEADDRIGAVLNFRDLTKHKGLWGKLRKERNKAQQYLNIADVIIVTINNRGVVTLINKKGLDVLGYKEHEIMEKNWYELCVPERDRESRTADFFKLMADQTGMVEDYENTILTKSGEERIIAWHNALLTDEKGHPIGTLSSGNDITMRKQTEAELIRAEKLASLGQLAASVAHEVNNPLAGIMVYIKLLLKKYRADQIQSDTTEEQLLRMEKELDRTTRIIRNLLDFARQSKSTMRPVDINKAIDAALQLVGHQINLENIHLVKDLDGDLPLVLADFDQIQQVLINMILNATQAMPEGGTLSLKTSKTVGIKANKLYTDSIRIDIMDTGIGIPKENLSQLFTPFFTTKKKGKGVGLGLSVVHGIIGRHKGRIEVESTPDSGTTFSIYLEAMNEPKGQSPHRR